MTNQDYDKRIFRFRHHSNDNMSALTRIFRNRFLFSVLIVGWALSGCNRADGSPSLPNSYDSPKTLARAVLDGLMAGDRDALAALRVTRDEHHDLLWEQLPESGGIPFEMAWGLNQRNSSHALDEALNRYGGTEFKFRSIHFREDPEIYDDFTLHRGAVLRVERLSDGKVGEVPILDVLLEYHGRWKLMNYVD